MSTLRAVNGSESAATKAAGVCLTLGQAVIAEIGLSKLAQMPAPPKVAYRIARLLRALNQETRDYYEQRQALLKRLGTERIPTALESARGITGPIWDVPAANRAEFDAQMKALEAEELPRDLMPLTMEDIESLGNVTGETLAQLGPLLAAE